MTSFGLNSNIIDIINKLFSQYEEIEVVKIFGSRANGNFKPTSDIDLVMFGKISNKQLRHIAFKLDELPTPYKFDVLNYDEIDNQNLLEIINKTAKIFYKKA